MAGDVDPEHPVPDPQELPGPEPAPASEVDHEATPYPVLFEYPEDARRGAEGKVGVADVVDVGEVFLVEAGHAGALWVSLAA